MGERSNKKKGGKGIGKAKPVSRQGEKKSKLEDRRHGQGEVESAAKKKDIR